MQLTSKTVGELLANVISGLVTLTKLQVAKAKQLFLPYFLDVALVVDFFRLRLVAA